MKIVWTIALCFFQLACAHSPDRNRHFRDVPIKHHLLIIFPEVQKHCNRYKNNTASVSFYPMGQAGPGGQRNAVRTIIMCSVPNEFGDSRVMQFYYGERGGYHHLIRIEQQTTVIDELRRRR